MNNVLALKLLLARIPGLRPLVRWLRGKPMRVPGKGRWSRSRGTRKYAHWHVSSSRHVPLGRAASRGAPPVVDREALRIAWAASPLAAETDTFVLYRILGNDLPPRHRDGQTRRNVAFLLEHEPELAGCEKRFVVNRIVDPREEEALLNLLERAGVPYLHIPFDPQAYRSIPWDIDGVPPEFAPWTRRFSLLSEERQMRVLMRLYRHKNNYVMNNNGARNAALEDGRSRAKWVLPWDGNCFITADAWNEIVAAVRAEAHLPYFLVPMARITDNSQLLDPGFCPQAKEEPQVVFRRDARLAFDPEFFYGRRPKVELFWRLGVPGKWDEWGIEPWDLPCPPYADEAGMYGQAGWVARLSSGQPHLERGVEYVVNRQRKTARNRAIQHLLDELDDAQACANGTRLALIDQDARALPAGLNENLRLAVEATLARSSVAEAERSGEQRRLFEDAFVLALGWWRDANLVYAQKAACLLREAFVDSGTAVAVEQRGATAIAGMAGVCLLPEALRLLESARVLDAKESGAVRDWLARYLDWLRGSEPGTKARSAPNSLGTCHDLQVVGIAGGLGEARVWRHALRDCRLRLRQQFGTEEAAMAAADLDERCFNLQLWVQLARFAEVLGEDLWSLGDARGPFLRRALDEVLREGSQRQDIAGFDAARLQPLHHARLRHYGFEDSPAATVPVPLDQTEPLFPPAYGILPFWQLIHGYNPEAAAARPRRHMAHG
jgi:hypothetical protein